MKNFTIIYNADKSGGMRYSFEAESTKEAIEFAKGKIDASCHQGMVIIHVQSEADFGLGHVVAIGTNPVLYWDKDGNIVEPWDK
ncbi:MAG: hypothetical protein MJZ30_11640 [Paludibacteraceae bacterium]|nr:hypothetical protein [Paludibacteraceae bacterium]